MPAAVLAAVALAAAAPAFAAERPRISVFGVRGDEGALLVAQLSGALCEEFECVPPEHVRTSGKLDFATVRARGVSGVLFGTATRTGKPRLALALLTTSFKPQRSWGLPLDASGRLDAASLARLSSELRSELKVSSELRPELKVSREVARAEPAASERSEPPTRTPAVVPSPPPRTREGGTIGVTPAARDTAKGARWAAVDLGAEYTQRKLSYSGIGASSSLLLSFKANSIVSPAVRAEVSPLVDADGRWYRGATMFAAYSRSVGLSTEAPTGAKSATVFSHLEIGAGLRFRPVDGWRGTILADASYQALSLEVSPRGAIPGLPAVDLAGPRLGLSLEAPLTGRFGLLAGAGYTYWVRSHDLVGDFFSSGSAWGFDVNGGVSIEVRGPFSIRALVDYARTSYKLSGTSAYRATGATDAYLGGRVLARVVF